MTKFNVITALICLSLFGTLILGCWLSTHSHTLPITDSKYLQSDPIEKEWHHHTLTYKFIKSLHITPMQLLETAKYINTCPPAINFYGGYPPTSSATTETRLKGSLAWWITLKDVQQLAKRVNSEVPCVRIYHPACSDLREGFSTEGIEAARMIYGYIHEGAYPTRLGEDWQKSAKPIVEEVKRWLSKNNISTN